MLKGNDWVTSRVTQKMDVRLKSFFRMIVSGPSGSGKTSWVCRFLQSAGDLIDRKPVRTIFYYNVWQDVYSHMEDTGLVHEFRQGAPSKDEILELAPLAEAGGSLVIIDDQLQNVNKETAEIFLVAGRHSGVSIIFLTQNLFPKDPHFRNISLQSSYIVLLKNPRDGSTITHLAKQLKPGNTRFLQDAYADATAKPFSYFFIDLHQKTPEKVRFRSNILPEESPQFAYVAK